MRKEKLTLIFCSLHLIPIFFNLMSIYFGNYENSIPKYAPLTPSELVGYSVYSIIYILIFSLSFYILAPKFLMADIKPNQFGRLSAITITKILYAFCFLASLIVLYSIFRQNAISYMISVRSGQNNVGILIYFVLIFLPITIAILLHIKNFYKWAAAGIAVLLVLNLLTGFRILLFWGVSVIVLTHLKELLKRNKFSLLVLGFSFFVLMYLFQEYREIVQGGLNGSSRGFVDSLNRSAPIHTMKLAFDNAVGIELFDFVEIIISPFILIINNVFGFNEFQAFDPITISDRLFSNYIFWRDTYYRDAGGFSINSLSFSIILMSGAGIFVMPFCSAAICSFGVCLYRSGSIIRRVTGALIITFTVFSVIESFVEAWKLLVYSLIFILLVVTVSLIFRVVIGNICRTSRVY
jgi:hypothetical protein